MEEILHPSPVVHCAISQMSEIHQILHQSFFKCFASLFLWQPLFFCSFYFLIRLFVVKFLSGSSLKNKSAFYFFVIVYKQAWTILSQKHNSHTFYEQFKH